MMPRHGGTGSSSVEGALPVAAAPLAGVCRINCNQREPGMETHSGQPITKLTGRDSGYRVPEPFAPLAPAHSFPADGTSGLEVQVLSTASRRTSRRSSSDAVMVGPVLQDASRYQRARPGS